MANKPVVIAVDLGGTKVSAALLGLDGELLFKVIKKVKGLAGKQVGKEILALIKYLMHTAKMRTYLIEGIGVCVPGIFHPGKKTVWAPNIPGWEDYPLYDEIIEVVQEHSISVQIESDRSCYILGEVWKGKAQGCRDAIFIAVGTGIGAGILCDGNVINGRSGIAGAIGWLALEPPYKEKYKACGNFEYYASGEGIARSAIEILEKASAKDSILAGIPIDTLSSYDVFAAYEKKDPIAIEVIDKAIYYWGMVVANLVSIFNPEKIIFGGGVFGPAAKFLNHIALEAEKWAQPISIGELKLEVSELEADAGLLGAGYSVLKSLENFKHGQ